MKLFQSHTHFDVYQNDAVTLVPSDYLPAEKALAKVPAVLFDVLENKHNQLVGHVDFRLGENQDLLTYAGHIGYDIFSQYRCRGFATQSCLCLANLARELEMHQLWITCNPDNHASNHVCRKLGARLVETVIIPLSHELYRRGDREKNRYLWLLSN